MTRGEAIKILQARVWAGCDHVTAAPYWIDALVELGMLKLDEPKSAWDKFKAVMVRDYGFAEADDRSSRTILYEIKSSLDAAGVKIVEK